MQVDDKLIPAPSDAAAFLPRGRPEPSELHCTLPLAMLSSPTWGAAATSLRGGAAVSVELAVVTTATEHELRDFPRASRPALPDPFASESDDFGPSLEQAGHAGAPSQPRMAPKRKRHAARQRAKKSARLDDSEAESPAKPRSMRAQHTAPLDNFTRKLKMYAVEGLSGRYLFKEGCFIDVADDILFEMYSSKYRVNSIDETILRGKLKTMTGQATVFVIEHADFEQRRSDGRRAYMFPGGQRLVFTDGGQPTFLSSTKVSDTFVFKNEVVKLDKGHVVLLGRFVEALKLAKEQAWQVIDTQPLRRLITLVAGRYADMYLTLLGRAFAGCSDADKWMVVPYSVTRNVGKTLLLRLLGKAQGSNNPLTVFLTDADRDAVAYRTGGDQARTRLAKRTSRARQVIIDELAHDKPVETAAIKALQNTHRLVDSHTVRMATFCGCTVNTAEPWRQFGNWSDQDAARMLLVHVAEGVDVATAEKNAAALSAFFQRPDAALHILALLTEYAQTPVPGIAEEHDWPTLNKREKPAARGGDVRNGCIADLLQAWLEKHGERLVLTTDQDAQLFRAPVYEAAGIAEYVRPGRGSSPVNRVLDTFILDKLGVKPSQDAGGNKSWCYPGVALR